MNNLLISGLLNWYHWKVVIDTVNREYFSKFKVDEDDMIRYNIYYLLNYRSHQDYNKNTPIFDFTNGDGPPNIVAKLPKNYW